MVVRVTPLDLFRGFAYPLRGIALLRRHRDLSRYWLPPIVIMGAALCFGTWLSVHYHEQLVSTFWPTPAQEGVTGGLLKAAHWLVELLVLLVALGLSLFACSLASTVIAAPFNDALSEAVEQREAGIAPPPFSLRRVLADLVRTVRLEALKLGAYLAVMLPLWLVSWLVPGVGQVLYVVVGALFTSFYFALDYIDWPASRRSRGIRSRLAVLRQRPMLMLGFGLCTWGLLFVPFFNLLLMPAAVAGGTRLFLDLEAEHTNPLNARGVRPSER